MMEFPFKGREDKYWFRSRQRGEDQIKGPLTPEKVKGLSRLKGEPDWLTGFRLRGLERFREMPMPGFGPDLSALDLQNMIFYSKPAERSREWKDVPEDIRETFEKLGLSEAEQKFLAGVELQYDSEVIFERAREELTKLGVVHMSMDRAVEEHPEIVREHLGKLVRPDNNKFAALNSAVWSGGTFIYVPSGVKVPFPLHTYFRINLEGFGQFERTLIVVEEGAEATYVEGCTAPLYSSATLHASVVEVIAKARSKVKFVTLQNWSKNVYNLVTKRARVHRDAFVQWISGNFGSGVTMNYPSIFLAEPGARGEGVSISMASSGQHLDTGPRLLHRAPGTRSSLMAKTITAGDGRATFRGGVSVPRGATDSRASVRCDSLLMDQSESNSTPFLEVRDETASLNHEASMGRLDRDKLLYLRSRGVPADQARSMLVFGFVRDFIEELPLEYAMELQRLIELDMGGGR